MFSVPKPEPTQAPANPFLDNPFAKAFQEMMANLGQPVAAAKPEAPKAEAAPAEETKATPESYAAMLNAMFDSGIEVQKNYQKSIETIFESYMPKTAPKA